MKTNALILALALTTDAMSAEPPKAEPFGQTPDGTPVEVFTLTNQHGIKLRTMTYGAIVLSLETPDRNGQSADIVLGYNTLADYVKDTTYFGAIVGRYGNRIAKGKFSVDGKAYTLATNNAPGGIQCSLHGGLKGFDKVVWRGEALVMKGAQGVKFTYTSKDGEEGFPGTLKLSVTYLLTDDNEWRIDYEATTDKATPVNVTQHSYFNLRGEGNGDILGHELTFKAAKFTPVTVGLIPTGELRPAATTTTGCSTTKAGNWRSPPPCGNPRQAACSRCSPPSPGCSSTAAISSTENSPARAASPIRSAAAFASKRSTIPIPPTSPPSRAPSLDPGRR